MPAGGLPWARNPSAGLQRFGTSCGLQFIPGSRKNLAQFNFCWKCGVQPARTLPVPRYPQRPLVVVDADKIQARRSQVLAAMEGRPGELQNLADEFDSFLLAYLAGSRGWTTATVDDLVDFLCFRDTQGKGTNMVHEASCPRVGRAGDDECREESSCARRYAAESLRKGCVSKLKMALKAHGNGEVWDPICCVGNPCASALVELYLTFVSEEQKQVGVPVNQPGPMLEHTLIDLLSDMRSRAQVADSLAEVISVTRDIALYALIFSSMRRGYDLIGIADPEASRI